MARFTAKRMAFGVQPAKAESTGDELHDWHRDWIDALMVKHA